MPIKTSLRIDTSSKPSSRLSERVLTPKPRVSKLEPRGFDEIDRFFAPSAEKKHSLDDFLASIKEDSQYKDTSKINELLEWCQKTLVGDNHKPSDTFLSGNQSALIGKVLAWGKRASQNPNAGTIANLLNSGFGWFKDKIARQEAKTKLSKMRTWIIAHAHTQNSQKHSPAERAAAKGQVDYLKALIAEKRIYLGKFYYTPEQVLNGGNGKCDNDKDQERAKRIVDAAVNAEQLDSLKAFMDARADPSWEMYALGRAAADKRYDFYDKLLTEITRRLPKAERLAIANFYSNPEVCRFNAYLGRDQDDEASSIVRRISSDKIDLIKDEKGNTLLHLAAQKGAFFSAKELCKKVLDFNILNRAGQSALLIAAQNDSLDVFKVILTAITTQTKGIFLKQDDHDRALLHLHKHLNVRDAQGKTALAVLKERQLQDGKGKNATLRAELIKRMETLGALKLNA
jgi:hypothetical protein